jgi:hypothetical protein
MKNEQEYPFGTYWILSRQLGLIGRNEADPNVQEDLHGQVLFLKAMLRRELHKDGHEKHLQAWRETEQQARRLMQKENRESVPKRIRYEQVSILVDLAKEAGILMEKDIPATQLEALEGYSDDLNISSLRGEEKQN